MLDFEFILCSPISSPLPDPAQLTSDLATFGQRPYQISLLPERWRELPGAEALLLRKILEIQGKDAASAFVHPVLAPVYAEAARMAGQRPIFTIHASTPQTTTARQAGLALENLLIALQGTRGETRRIVMHNEANGQRQPALFAKALSLCSLASNDAEGLAGGKYDAEIGRLYQELNVIRQMFNAVEMPEGKLVLLGNSKCEASYMPTGFWQSARVPVEAPPNVWINFQPYDTPCKFWFRNAQWNVEGSNENAWLRAGPDGALTEEDGLCCLTVLGPRPAAIKTPRAHASRFEIEFVVQSSETTLSDIIVAQHGVGS